MSENRPGSAGMPRLNHAEAEQLISSRLDAPLPADQNRILLAHLATCPSCRTFANQIEAMTQGLRGLPMLPASPTVSRQVRERIAEGQSSWSRFSRLMFGGRWGAMPAMASALVLVAAVTFGLILNGDGNSGNERTPIAAANSTDIAMTREASPSPELNEIEPTLAPTNTPSVRRRDEDKPTPLNVQVQLTETPEPTGTATLEPTATVTASATNEPTETATTEPTETVEPTATATDRPTDEPTATSTATTEPTETPEPTETATIKSTETESPPTETAQPTRTPTTEPSETAVPPTETPQPTRTATDTPTKTATPTLTSTAEPTSTNTPRPTRTPTDEPTETPRPTRTPTEEPTETPRPTLTPTEEPTETPEPTATPTETVQPKIVPIGGGDATEEVTEPTTEPDTTDIEYLTPTEVPVDETTPESNTRIVPIGGDGPEVTENATEEDPSNQGGENGTSDLTETVESGALSDADEIGAIGSGVSAPAGGLRMPVDLAYLIVTGPDGALAVADGQGNLVQSLGSALFPIWSPLGLILAYEDASGDYPAVVTWDREDGTSYPIGAESESAVSDTPAGWIGAQLYYLRSFPDSPGTVELRRANWNGEEDSLVWSGEGIELNGERPVATFDGVLIPTTTSWYYVSVDGSFSELTGSNGFVGEPLLSPLGSLLAYSLGSQLFIASSSDPGNAQFAIDYPDGYSGFDFSPDGTQIVVSDGATLRIYSTSDGSLISEASGGAGAAFPHWSDDGIRYLDLGEVTTLKLIQPDAFQPVS